VPVLRVERAVYGVADIEECERFFADLGLTSLGSSEMGSTMRLRSGQVVELRRLDDPDLPPAVEEGSTLRELVWGVDDVRSLERIAERLGRDRPLRVDGTTVRTVDETGYGVGVTLAQEVVLPAPPPGYNRTGQVVRWNQPRPMPSPPLPLRLCHAALNIPKQGREAAVDFYVDRLGFKVTDRVRDMGVFMRADGDADQHTFLLCHRPDRASVNHTAYEMDGFDDVILGANAMIERGWREARRLGRHTIGSNVFRFLHAPCGGRVELASDMDRVDDSYGPNDYEETPPHHLWVMPSSRDSEVTSS
jgi:catechol 2,3-dioxygenase-like lactoylglutathione lyase family enzyme